MNKIISEVKSLLALILIVLLLKETVIELYIVPTTSMERNILKGDMLVGSRFAYGMKVPQKIWVPFTAISIPTFLPEYRFPAFKKVERGDVVVFEYPRDIVYKYVKRCIGLPGDTISIKDREVYVNGDVSVLPDGGQFLMDTYMSSDIIDDEIFLGVSGNKDQYPEITIPKKGDIFTLDESMNWKFLLPIILYEGNSVELIYQEQKFNFTNDSPRDIFRRTGDRSVFKDYVPTVLQSAEDQLGYNKKEVQALKKLKDWELVSEISKSVKIFYRGYEYNESELNRIEQSYKEKLAHAKTIVEEIKEVMERRKERIAELRAEIERIEQDNVSLENTIGELLKGF